MARKNAKDHRERKNPRMHELWMERKKVANAAKRAANAEQKNAA